MISFFATIISATLMFAKSDASDVVEPSAEQPSCSPCSDVAVLSCSVSAKSSVTPSTTRLSLRKASSECNLHYRRSSANHERRRSRLRGSKPSSTLVRPLPAVFNCSKTSSCGIPAPVPASPKSFGTRSFGLPCSYKPDVSVSATAKSLHHPECAFSRSERTLTAPPRQATPDAPDNARPPKSELSTIRRFGKGFTRDTAMFIAQRLCEQGDEFERLMNELNAKEERKRERSLLSGIMSLILWL